MRFVALTRRHSDTDTAPGMAATESLMEGPSEAVSALDAVSLSTIIQWLWQDAIVTEEMLKSLQVSVAEINEAL